MAGEPTDDNKLAELRVLAQAEMRRTLPDERAPKRHKGTAAPAAPAAAAAALGGRFDYRAIAELESGLSGFLLTCPLQREGSARREAVPILHHHLQQCGWVLPEGSSNSAGPAAAAEPAEAADGAPAAAEAEGAEAAAAGQAGSLAAIKLACRGLVAFKLVAGSAESSEGGTGGAETSNGNANTSAPAPADSSVPPGALLVQQAAAALLADVKAGRQQRLAQVQRVIPVQTTCRLERAALEAAGGRLAAIVAASRSQAAPEGQAPAAAAPGAGAAGAEGQQDRVTFGIGLKQRSLGSEDSKAGQKGNGQGGAGGAAGQLAEENAAAASGGDGKAAEPAPPLDRGAIISSLAAGFESALRERHSCQAAVDLKAPDWVLVLEVLPAGGALYAALCALPASLCVLKPKLHIRAVGKASA